MERYSKSLILLFLCIKLCNGGAVAQASVDRYPLIPYPTALTPGAGDFIVTSATTLALPDGPLFKEEAAALNQLFRNGLGTPLKTVTKTGSRGIVLAYDESIRAEEGYGLVITPQHVALLARTTAGMFMAVQTFRQLLPASAERPVAPALKQLLLPALTIYDEPAYAWRGMHLDVSRHFFSIGYLKKFIDVMALYKFNTFHLHLTDDEGWRIEIKKYPRLTEVGAWRTFNNQDSGCMQRAVDNPDMAIDPAHIIHKDGKTLYGGFYTQAEMKGLVAYAARKHIVIVPEIDMPGHMMAAINQYPYLSCDGASVFGELFSTPICPCLPTTFQFAQDVYTEIMDIFPSKYIHIGGDEVDRRLWARSPECKVLMEKEGLKNTAELQSYFISKMEQFFNSRGRKLVGWDEVLEGGISKTAMVMYWRSWVPKAPVEAAKNGNQVIMTPGNPLYFDAIPDKNSLPAVYHFQVVPFGLTEAEGKNIIGAQANIWTEMIPSEKRADYMYMPRMTALAEVLWTHRRDYDGYLGRLQKNYGRLDVLKVNYRLPDLPGLFMLNVFTDRDTLWIKKPLEELTIRYTTDGSAPDKNSRVLNQPLVIRQTQLVRVAAFRRNGLRGDIYNLQYQQQAPAEPERAAQVSDGLVCSQYKGSFRNVAGMGKTADTVLKVQTFEVPKAAEAPGFGLRYRGYLDIPQDGVYSFYLTCDDGGVLKIANRVVVDNDGLHSAIEKNGQVALKKGLQAFALDFIEGGGGYTLKLKYSLKGGEQQDIPAGWLKN